jgi:sarcosine oxidase
VLGIDRFPGGHDRGSSHGATRVIRQAYFEHPDYVPLLLKAYTLWAELESLAGTRLLEQVGLLQVGPPDGEVVPGVLRCAREHRLAVDELAPAEAMQRFPGFHIAGDQAAVFERKAGYLRVEQCVLAHLAAAKAAGAELQFGPIAQSWSVDGSGVRVVTDAGQFTADKLVIAAGPWAAQLLGGLGVPFQVLRKRVYWFASDDDGYRQESGCPTYLFEMPTGIFYGFPQIDTDGVKAAEHTGGERIADPLQASAALAPDSALGSNFDFGRVQRFLRECLPGVICAAALRSGVCYYTMSPDGHFVVDRHPASDRVVFAAGLSGHGFKFTSVLGAALADLALDGATQLPIGFLGFRRLAR